MRDAQEQGQEIVKEMEEETTKQVYLNNLERDIMWANAVAQLYYKHSDFLYNQAKVRGTYLKELRKNGFSKRTAELMVFAYFDEDDDLFVEPDSI